MRNNQPRLVDHRVAVENQIEIERARRAAVRARAAEVLLDRRAAAPAARGRSSEVAPTTAPFSTGCLDFGSDVGSIVEGRNAEVRGPTSSSASIAELSVARRSPTLLPSAIATLRRLP